MSDMEKGNTDMMQRIQSSYGTSSSLIPKQPQSMNQQLDVPHLNPSLIRSRQFQQFTQPFNSNGNGADSNKRVGIPPSHPNPIPPISPYSQISSTRQHISQNFNAGPTHSRSMSQPSSFFSFDSLPPLSPSPYRDSPSASMSDHEVVMDDRETGGFNPSTLPPSPFTRCNNSGPTSSKIAACESLPPRKAHRRSNSDIPFGFNSMMGLNSPPLAPPRPLERSVSGGDGSDWSKVATLVKRETSSEREGAGERKTEGGDVVEDLFSAYMNLENIDVLNSSGAEDSKNGNDNKEDMDMEMDMESSKASGTKTNGGDSSDDTEGESSVNESRQKTGTATSVKRRAAGGDIAPTTRHYRSVSMDSCFMGKLNFGDESQKPAPGKASPTNSIDGNSSNFSLELGNNEFTAAEMKKIMANEKLVEIAVTDPKRVKRILANRQSAARSKERKMRYISELEHKVQTLQTEATTLSAQLTLLQRDSMGLTNQNNELKFRLQAMEQQAQLRDALNEALSAEVQRLKMMSGESDRLKVQSLNPEMFQQLNISNLHQSQSQPSDQRQTQSRSLSESNHGDKTLI